MRWFLQLDNGTLHAGSFAVRMEPWCGSSPTAENQAANTDRNSGRVFWCSLDATWMGMREVCLTDK